MPAWFITGTDTNVGKTHCACALLHAGHNAGFSTLAMKPVAAGIDPASGHNDDVDLLMAAASVAAPHELINPYCFAPAIAPHIAAAEAGTRISLDVLRAAFNDLQARADLLLVEGAGGFCVPLGDDIDSADLARHLEIPVILVVGMRLGCLNHALLSVEAIRARGLQVAGWIANCIDPAMERAEENRVALTQRIAAPCLGVVPFGCTPESAAKLLKLPLA